MKKNLSTKIKECFSSTRELLQKFLNWKKEDIRIWILKVILILAAVIISILLYKIILTLMPIALLFVILCSDRFENAINNFGNIPDTTEIHQIHNGNCVTALFSVLKDNFSIFNVVQPKAITELFPDISKYCNPQTVENMDFFRYPVKVHDENKVMDFQNLTATLNVMIAKKLQNGEMENVPFSSYNDIPSIQVLKISPDFFNPAFYAFDLMVIDTDEKYNYILRKQQIEQAKEVYQAAPVDEDF